MNPNFTTPLFKGWKNQHARTFFNALLKSSFLFLCGMALTNTAYGQTTDVTITILLDNYPEETSWEITNSNGISVASGGTYGSEPDGSTVTIVETLSDGCYDFIISDSYGDGICCGYGQGNYSVTDPDGNILVSGAEFSFSESTNFCLNNTPPPPPPPVISFTDQSSLLATTDFNSGVAMGIVDVNGDLKDDIVRMNQGYQLNIEYQTSPNGAFNNYSFGDVSNESQWSMCLADVDENGVNDILVGGSYDNVKLIKGTPGGGYPTFNLSTLDNSNMFIQGSNFVDIDNDGAVDIFACHDDADSRKWKNDGAGNFSLDNLIDTELPGSNEDNSGNYASIWTDYDNDGDLDMYLSKCRGGVSDPTDIRRINRLFQNDGSNNFTDVAGAAGLQIGDQTWSADFADIDNDGDMDVFMINHYTPSMLFQNNGDGTFTDITAGSGIDFTFFGIQALFRDFDNDGFVDLIVTGKEHRLYKNNGDLTFSSLAKPFGTDDIESIAVGDLNDDGSLDVYAGYANFFTSPSNIDDQLFMNDGNGNNYFLVALQGNESNRNGIGAKISIYGSWGVQIREVRSGEGYGIMNSLTRHFGLGQATSIDKVVVDWPSGITQEILNPVINQTLLIEETEPSCPDSDGDGTCDADDCQPNDSNFPAAPGSACDDGNANTTNDTVTADGCGCEGTPTGGGDPDCANLSISTGSGSITVSGLDGAPISSLQIFNSSWGQDYNCFADCAATTTVNVPQGTYYVYAKYYTAGYAFICELVETVTVSGTSGPGPCDDQGGDSDGDGTCDDDDCQPNDANFPATPGAACDDGNPATTGDTVTVDGCGCEGTPTGAPDCANISISTGSGSIIVSGLDGAPIASLQIFNSSWGQEFNCFANCNPTSTVNVSAGTYYVYAKYYDAGYGFLCEKVETVTVTGTSGPGPCDDLGGDSDGDGTCDDDDCQPNNPDLPATPGSACDDGDFTTTNDQVTTDGCGCEGTPSSGGGDCANIQIETAPGQIIISNLDGAPVSSLQIFSSNWATTYFTCFGDCNATETINLTAGDYIILTKYYDASWSLTCERYENVSVSNLLIASGAFEFEAVKHEEHSELIWLHNDGENIMDYTLERSVDGLNFETVFSLESKGGNNAEIYHAYDFEPSLGDNIYRVRLDMVDGRVDYSNLQILNYPDLAHVLLFPNPANNFVKANLEDIIGYENVTITVFNSLGVAIKQFELSEINSRFYQMDIRDLKEGHYIVWFDIPGRRSLAKQLMVGKR